MAQLRWIALALLIGAVFAAFARADSAPVATPDSLDHRPIVREAAGASVPQPAAPTNSSTNGFEPARVVLALVVVLALILLLRVALRRFFPGAIPHRATRAIKILSRSIVSPKQHLLLIQIGKRLVVVGDSGAQLNPLCEITNEEEIAAIMAQVREESATAARRFDLLFGRARKGFDEDHAPPQPIDSPAEAVFDPSHEINDPALSETHHELVGLSDKVRDLARQLRSD